MTTPILEFQNIRKSYQGNPVLKGISFSLAAGEIHGLIGENGAGKSTLMNILFGMPVIHKTGGFEGKIILNGAEVNFQNPKDAMAAGIGMVHQEFMLIPGFTVFENIKLNSEPTLPNKLNACLPNKLKILDFKRMQQEATNALTRIGLSLDETELVSNLPVGHKQFVEIAREIANPKVKLLVFDEPTAVLTESEAATLLKTIKTLAKDFGIAILFISHRLDEIEQICDRITVLRDGENVGQFNNAHVNKEQMAELMVGHKVAIDFNTYPNRVISLKDDILELKNFSVQMPSEAVHNIDLKIHRGEILGIGGLAGQGKLGIANGLAGLYPATGEVLLDGKVIELGNTLASLNNGIGFVSEDRRGMGLWLDDSIENNIAFTAMNIKNLFLKKIFGIDWIQSQKVREHANAMITMLDIRCRNPKQQTRRLSGGNQQKVCLARMMTLGPRVLMVSEPTRGVDIGAKKLILEKLLEINAKYGTTIILTSSELVELKSISDRIVIFSRGKISNILTPKDTDKDYGLAMSA